MDEMNDLDKRLQENDPNVSLYESLKTLKSNVDDKNLQTKTTKEGIARKSNVNTLSLSPSITSTSINSLSITSPSRKSSFSSSITSPSIESPSITSPPITSLSITSPSRKSSFSSSVTSPSNRSSSSSSKKSSSSPSNNSVSNTIKKSRKIKTESEESSEENSFINFGLDDYQVSDESFENDSTKDGGEFLTFSSNNNNISISLNDSLKSPLKKSNFTSSSPLKNDKILMNTPSFPKQYFFINPSTSTNSSTSLNKSITIPSSYSHKKSSISPNPNSSLISNSSKIISSSTSSSPTSSFNKSSISPNSISSPISTSSLKKSNPTSLKKSNPTSLTKSNPTSLTKSNPTYFSLNIPSNLREEQIFLCKNYEKEILTLRRLLKWNRDSCAYDVNIANLYLNFRDLLKNEFFFNVTVINLLTLFDLMDSYIEKGENQFDLVNYKNQFIEYLNIPSIDGSDTKYRSVDDVFRGITNSIERLNVKAHFSCCSTCSWVSCNRNHSSIDIVRLSSHCKSCNNGKMFLIIANHAPILAISVIISEEVVVNKTSDQQQNKWEPTIECKT